ncbi:MAG: hypothetical protein AAGF23_06295, partial [Acidobacteriota bacterium]
HAEQPRAHGRPTGAAAAPETPADLEVDYGAAGLEAPPSFSSGAPAPGSSPSFGAETAGFGGAGPAGFGDSSGFGDTSGVGNPSSFADPSSFGDTSSFGDAPGSTESPSFVDADTAPGSFDAFEPPAEDYLSPPVLETDDFFGGATPEGIDWGTGSFGGDLAVSSLESSEPVAAGASPVGADADRQQLLGLLGDLEVLINRMTASSSSHHKSFLMIHRLLKRGRAIPPAMVQSMQPYLFDLMNELLPKLHEGPLEADFGDYANRLIQDCQLLCQLNFSGDELKTHVAPAMQSIVDLLDDLRRLISRRLDELSGY